MSNPIVTINVSQTIAPSPPTLQKTGAFISQGATNTSPGTKSLLKQLADLTPLLTGAKTLTSITWSGAVATATAAAPHGFVTGDTMLMTIAGETPVGYNGTFLATITGASTFTYPLASNPGSQTVAGVYTPEDVGELVAMATTFFAQGSQQAVYVLELGAGNAADGVTFLTAWIAANPEFFYAYLVPRYWDSAPSFLTMLGQFNTTTSKTYFYVTTTLQNYLNYTAQMKCAVTLIEAPGYGVWPANVLTALSQVAGAATATTTTNHGVLPGQYFQLAGNTPSGWNGTFLALAGTATNNLAFAVPSTIGAESVLGTLVSSQYSSAGVPSTEFSQAAPFWVALNYAPAPTNRVTPFNLSYLFDVTAFPTQGNASMLATIAATNVNVVGTGAQGGISSTILLGGNTMDGNPVNYWYSVDWVQINVQRNVTAALINGSNNPVNPIYYDQNGINALQQVAVSTMNSGISNGLVLFPVKPSTMNAADFKVALDADDFAGFTVVNADPFLSYSKENPNDYATGIYNGFSIGYTPLRGFSSIVFNVTVTNFVA